MQRLYLRNRRRAVREVLEIPTVQCPVSQEDLKSNFYPDAHGSYDPNIFTNNTLEIKPPDTSSFTPAEVKAKLAKCENTAPCRIGSPTTISKGSTQMGRPSAASLIFASNPGKFLRHGNPQQRFFCKKGATRIWPASGGPLHNVQAIHKSDSK